MNNQEFAVYWSLLLERYNRNMSGPMSRVYRGILDAEQITAEEWARAVSECIRYEQFWPSPQQLVDYARPQGLFTEKALSEWDDVVDAISKGRSLTEDAEIRRALRLSGNGANIRHVDHTALRFIKREFIERRTKHHKSKSKTPDALSYENPQRLTSSVTVERVDAHD